MIQLEEIDPVLIDHAIRRVLAMKRAPDREIAIANHLGGSAELMEFAEMIQMEPPPDPDPRTAALSKILSAVAVGLEVGYQLGFHEAERERSRMK